MKFIKIVYPSIIISLLLISTSCEKDTIEIEKFDMSYQLILNGDDSVTSISLDTWTTFPEENKTEWIGKTKRKRYEDDHENHLSLYDTICIIPSLKVYKSCTRSIKIRLRFNEGTDMEKYRDYDLGYDTILGYYDSNFIFTWPADSSKYEYIER